MDICSAATDGFAKDPEEAVADTTCITQFRNLKGSCCKWKTRVNGMVVGFVLFCSFFDIQSTKTGRARQASARAAVMEEALKTVLDIDEGCLYLSRMDAARLSMTCAPFQDVLPTWIFLRHRLRLGLRCRRAFSAMVRQLRRMGLLRLYMVLHDTINVQILLLAFDRYRDRHAQFRLSSSVHNFFSLTYTPLHLPASNEWMWAQSRRYLRRLHHAASTRRFFVFHQLCMTDAPHAARRYPMLGGAQPDLKDLGGFAPLMHIIHHSAWPPSVLEALLRSIRVAPPTMWLPALHTAADRLQLMPQRRALRAWRRRAAGRGGGSG